MAEPEQLRRTRATSSVTAHRSVTGPAVVATFRAAITQHGTPFSTLTDNGMAFTTRFAQRGRTSRNALENEFVELRVRQKNSRPNHPTTCGKVERFHQTRKKWLRTHLADPPDHENQTDRTLTGVRSVSDVPRHHIRSFVRSFVELGGIEPPSISQCSARDTTIPDFETDAVSHRRVGQPPVTR